MTKSLLIVFVKNITLGTVKTRLAHTIGDFGAYEVYKELVSLTEQTSNSVSCDKQVYFSTAIEDSLWPNAKKYLQKGDDLGERMYNAFKNGFDSGYERIVLIGSDLADLAEEDISKGLEQLQNNEVVFGPADDGGYYLIGLSSLRQDIFINKPWSQSYLLQETLSQLSKAKANVALLDYKNDIDTYNDLINSDFYKSNKQLQEKIKQLNAQIH
ncbi:MAG: glycosyltransferase [Winogradskyella sp.]|nr:glycosyltransferase [Winogradskyella sp.]